MKVFEFPTKNLSIICDKSLFSLTKKSVRNLNGWNLEWHTDVKQVRLEAYANIFRRYLRMSN